MSQVKSGYMVFWEGHHPFENGKNMDIAARSILFFDTFDSALENAKERCETHDVGYVIAKIEGLVERPKPSIVFRKAEYISVENPDANKTQF